MQWRKEENGGKRRKKRRVKSDENVQIRSKSAYSMGTSLEVVETSLAGDRVALVNTFGEFKLLVTLPAVKIRSISRLVVTSAPWKLRKKGATVSMGACAWSYGEYSLGLTNLISIAQ